MEHSVSPKFPRPKPPPVPPPPPLPDHSHAQPIAVFGQVKWSNDPGDADHPREGPLPSGQLRVDFSAVTQSCVPLLMYFTGSSEHHQRTEMLTEQAGFLCRVGDLPADHPGQWIPASNPVLEKVILSGVSLPQGHPNADQGVLLSGWIYPSGFLLLMQWDDVGNPVSDWDYNDCQSYFWLPVDYTQTKYDIERDPRGTPTLRLRRV